MLQAQHANSHVQSSPQLLNRSGDCIGHPAAVYMHLSLCAYVCASIPCVCVVQHGMQVFLLEGENRKLSRALIREVGEGVPLSKVLEEGGAGSDWKGRREQIIRLQDTIKQLKEAAQAAGGGNISGSSSSSSLAKHETAHRNVIGKLNKQKEVDLQRMAAELEGAQQAAEQLRLKYTGAASRRKVLEEEVRSSGSGHYWWMSAKRVHVSLPRLAALHFEPSTLNELSAVSH